MHIQLHIDIPDQHATALVSLAAQRLYDRLSTELQVETLLEFMEESVRSALAASITSATPDGATAEQIYTSIGATARRMDDPGAADQIQTVLISGTDGRVLAYAKRKPDAPALWQGWAVDSDGGHHLVNDGVGYEAALVNAFALPAPGVLAHITHSTDPYEIPEQEDKTP